MQKTTVLRLIPAALGIVLAAVYDRKVARRQNPGYTITGFADKKF